MLDRITDSLNSIEGKISVEGHTDSIPISTAAYASNWDLSAARAVSVANQMLASTGLPPDRLTVSGFADTRPQASNDDWEGRAQNRRVEIVVKQPLAESEGDFIEALRNGDDEALDALDITNF